MDNEVKIFDVKIGDGEIVKKGALVFILYNGFLENGTKFDSSYDKGKVFEMVVGSSKIIKGMSLGLLGMKEGGKRKIEIPAHLAYGDRVIGDKIPAHANLIFEIELIEARNRE